MNNEIVNFEKDIGSAAKIASRPAWRLLAAEYSERQNITPARWRLLDTAFRTVNDEQLAAAALEHMKEKPGLFPGVGDIWQQLTKLYPPTDWQKFERSLHQYGYDFKRSGVDDDGRPVYIFKHRTNGRVFECLH